MAEVTIEMVKELREKTGAGVNDCKKALAETSGDIGKAVDYLREKGIAGAAKKATELQKKGLFIHTSIQTINLEQCLRLTARLILWLGPMISRNSQRKSQCK